MRTENAENILITERVTELTLDGRPLVRTACSFSLVLLVINFVSLNLFS